MINRARADTATQIGYFNTGWNTNIIPNKAC